MDKFVFFLISALIVSAALLTGLAVPGSQKDDMAITGQAGAPATSHPPILRKEITFTVDGTEYKTGDPNEKFLLAGKDKDLTSKLPTMSKVGEITLEGKKRDVWRCHVYDLFQGRELSYLYVLTDKTNIMDVYLAEKDWEKRPHDAITVSEETDIIPIDEAKIDLKITIRGEEKIYTLIRERNNDPRKSRFRTKDLSLTLVGRNNQVGTLGLMDIYEVTSDRENATVYALPASTTIDPATEYEFYTLGRLIAIDNTAARIDSSSLQLKQIKFVTVSTDGWWLPDCKPAIYLYPQQPTNVQVRVLPKGFLTLTIPQYPLDGWNVSAEPDGTITHDGKTYPYLYYEAKIHDSVLNKPEKGFVVAYDKLSTLYDKILPQLGLHTKEADEFKAYWKKALPISPYYFVGVLDRSITDFIEPLTITPKPDTIIRVRLYFEALEKPIVVLPPEMQTPKRQGFTVVEWGGMVKLDKQHEFTCSQ